MRKINLLIITLLLNASCFAQIPVTDGISASILTGQAIVQAEMAALQVEQAAIQAEQASLQAEQSAVQQKELIEQANQTKTLYDSYTSLQKGLDVYKKVSNKIKSAESIIDLLDEQYRFTKYCAKVLSYLSEMNFNISEIRRANLTISNLLRRAGQNIDLVIDLLVDNGLLTDDGTRVLIIRDIIKAQRELDHELRFYERLYYKKQKLHAFYKREIDSYKKNDFKSFIRD
ncbi:MAG: hypothetical protein COA88_12985 [Kordia sp.]|nr:MAG: hypothetical protein COA88_12985 [Kordia sp.]